MAYSKHNKCDLKNLRKSINQELRLNVMKIL